MVLIQIKISRIANILLFLVGLINYIYISGGLIKLDPTQPDPTRFKCAGWIELDGLVLTPKHKF